MYYQIPPQMLALANQCLVHLELQEDLTLHHLLVNLMDQDLHLERNKVSLYVNLGVVAFINLINLDKFNWIIYGLKAHCNK